MRILWKADSVEVPESLWLYRADARRFVAGGALFAGTLYLMALGAPRWLGAVTPVGGAMLIVGWLWLAWGMRG